MAEQDRDDSNLGKFASYGLQIGAGVGLGLALGWWLDRRYPSLHPWCEVVGAMLGFASGMYLLIKDGLKANKD